MTPEEIARKVAYRVFLDAWHGPGGAERRFSATAVAGLAFDPDAPDDTAPYTPEEVRTQVGYVRLQVDEIDAGGDGVSAGEEGGKIVAGEEALLNLQFAIRIPSEADQVLAETYAAAAGDAFRGLYVEHQGPPWVSLRNIPSVHPHRRRDQSGRDDGPWRLSYLDVRLLRRTRNAHVGAQEVSI